MITLIRVSGYRNYVWHVERQRLAYPDLRARILQLAEYGDAQAASGLGVGTTPLRLPPARHLAQAGGRPENEQKLFWLYEEVGLTLPRRYGHERTTIS